MRHGTIITEIWGGVLIRVQWEIQMDAIIDFRFRYSDAENNVKEEIDTLFPRGEHMKKDKHIWHCHDQWKHFSLFVLSVMDGNYRLIDQFSPW